MRSLAEGIFRNFLDPYEMTTPRIAGSHMLDRM
jgi:hypothetical protein